MSRKKIAILTTGGTISSLDSSEGVKPADGVIEYILEAISFDKSTLISNDGKTEVKIIPILNKDSTNITLHNQVLLANEIFSLESKYDGIIITHGTDTMQFTSSLLSIMLESPNIPIILTGSMKTIKDKNTDAIKNLSGSIEFAKSQLSGVFVFFHENLIPGQLAYETRVDSNLTFRSAAHNVATLKNGKVSYNVKISDPNHLVISQLNANYDSNVLTVTISPSNTETSLFDVEKKYNGVILLSYGSAGIPKQYITPINRLIKNNIPVVLSSQVPSIHIGPGIYKINKVANELGIISGIGLHSFDFANMVSSLGTLRVENKSSRSKLERFEKLFEKNIKSALDPTYFRKSTIYKEMVNNLSGNTDSDNEKTNSELTKLHRTIKQSQRALRTC